MLRKTILPLLALSSILLNDAVSAAEMKLSTKAFKDDGKASKKGEKGDGTDHDNKATELSSKASESKAGKIFKSKFAKSKFEKAGSSKAHKQTMGSDDDVHKKDSIDYEPLNTRTDYRPEFLNEDYWHPKSSNFEIIDWDKWESTCGDIFDGETIIYDPPQRSKKPAIYMQNSDEMIWWQRSQLKFPQTWSESVQPNTGKVGDDLKIFAKLLGPSPNSSLIPKPMRNNLFWMQENDASELLISFNRGAWRSNTPEGRSIGLSYMGEDWTKSPNLWGKRLSDYFVNGIVNWQVSPNGKWIKFALIRGDPSDPESTVSWLGMYIVQEGDVFKDRNDKFLTDVEPGDIMRFEFEGGDAYDCNPDNYKFQYFPRKVAILVEATGKITPNSPHYGRLLDFLAAQPPAELHLKTHGFTNATSMTQGERFDFQVMYPSEYQQYVSAPTPPHGDDIENL